MSIDRNASKGSLSLHVSTPLEPLDITMDETSLCGFNETPSVHPGNLLLRLPLEIRLQIYAAVVCHTPFSFKKQTRPYAGPGELGRRILRRYKILNPASKLLMICKQVNSEVRQRVYPQIPLDLSLHALALQSDVWKVDFLSTLINSSQRIICSVKSAHELFEHHRSFRIREAWFSCHHLRELTILDTSPLLFALTQPESNAWRMLFFEPNNVAYTTTRRMIDRSNRQFKLESLKKVLKAFKDRGPIIKIRSPKPALKHREIEFSSANKIIVRGIRDEWAEIAKRRIIFALQVPYSTTIKFEYHPLNWEWCPGHRCHCGLYDFPHSAQTVPSLPA